MAFRQVRIAAAVLIACGSTSAIGAAAQAASTEPPPGMAASESPAFQQLELDTLAATMGLRYAIVDNHPPVCPDGVADCFLTELTLTMPARVPARQGGLSLYFSFVNRLPLVESDLFRHEPVNGDLHRLTWRLGVMLRPGQVVRVRLWGVGAHPSTAFAMPNMYLAHDGMAPRIIAATRPTTDPDTGLERLAFVAPMTDEARLATKGGDDATRWQTPELAYAAFAAQGEAVRPEIAIVPTPQQITLRRGSPVDLTRGVALHLRGVTSAELAPALAALERAGVGVGAAPRARLNVRIDPALRLASEGYRLTVARGGVQIIARDLAGAGHAIQSLAQQVIHDRGRLRPFVVTDAPRYGFRGLHIDVARNFHSKAQVLKLIDAMDAYKFNKLHLHLADDEGWRLEIAGLPELTEVGSRRCHDRTERTCLSPQLGAGPHGDSEVNGYYSQSDYRDILRAAAARQIEVIPSIDMPGHSRAAIRSMEARYERLLAAGHAPAAAEFRLTEPGDGTVYRSIQNYDDNTLNVCIEPTYRFLNHVVDAIAAMHAAEGTPLKTFHLGADETAGAWTQSPACRALTAKAGIGFGNLSAYFIERVANDLAQRGLKVAGWSDGMGHVDTAHMPAAVQSNIWGTLFTTALTEAHEQANRGWDVVLSIPDIGYLDMPHVPHPVEGGYNWASRSVDTAQIHGFMTDNLAANAARIRNIRAQPVAITDPVPLHPGRAFAGIQAQLWSETTRTGAGVDYQLFPRLIAVAERAWHRPAWEPPYVPGQAYAAADARVDEAAIRKDWDDFRAKMPAQFDLLDRIGVAYRVTPPGARVVDGRLDVATEFPGQAVEFRQGTGLWQPFAGSVAVAGTVDVRTRSADGRRASRTVTVP